MLVNNCGCPLKSSDSNCGLTWRVRGITACQTDTHTSLLHTDYSTLSLSHRQTAVWTPFRSLSVTPLFTAHQPSLCYSAYCVSADATRTRTMSPTTLQARLLSCRPRRDPTPRSRALSSSLAPTLSTSTSPLATVRDSIPSLCRRPARALATLLDRSSLRRPIDLLVLSMTSCT